MLNPQPLDRDYLIDSLDDVEAVGVSRWLLRISVGTEPLEDLWGRFAAALDGV